MKRTKITHWSYGDYIFHDSKEQTAPVYLLLHGYGERAKRIARVLAPYLPEDAAWIAPNGPFPLPKKVESPTGPYYQIGHAWYFYDDLKDTFFIDYSFPAQWLRALLEKLDLLQRPIIVIGYSQGGYLAPFAAQELPNCQAVIGLNCRFRHDLLPAVPPSYPVHALHAEQDSKVSFERAQNSHQALVERGYSGGFHSIPNQDHELTPPLLEKLKELLQRSPS